MKLTFKACREADIAALDRLNPSPSVESFHRQRFADQQSGTGCYLLAWRRNTPVAHTLIRWNGCGAAEIRKFYPRCPEINGLEVFPQALRSRGIGSALIRAAEELAIAEGFASIGLGVADLNPDASRLYRRLGYAGGMRYLDRYSCLDSAGTRHEFADPCVFLVKAL